MTLSEPVGTTRGRHTAILRRDRRRREDARELEGALRKSIGGEVRFDEGSRAIYATDRRPASRNPRQRPRRGARAELRDGLPRDEMANLLPEDADARALTRLAKTLGELLAETPGWQAPVLKRRALLHVHCHHKAVLDASAEWGILEAMGLKIEAPAPACCGHAGAFGYEAEHHPVSMQIGEQVLLPNVRAAADDTLIIADGFSCRQQIKDGAGRWAMHPAEALALALEAPEVRDSPDPARRYLEPAAAPGAASMALGVSLGVIGLAVGFLALRQKSSRERGS